MPTQDYLVTAVLPRLAESHPAPDGLDGAALLETWCRSMAPPSAGFWRQWSTTG